MTEYVTDIAGASYVLTTENVNRLYYRFGISIDIGCDQIRADEFDCSKIDSIKSELITLVSELIPNVFEDMRHWTDCLRRFDGTFWAYGKEGFRAQRQFVQMCIAAGLAEAMQTSGSMSLEIRFLPDEVSRARIAAVGPQEMASRWLHILRHDQIYNVASGYYDHYLAEAGCDPEAVGSSGAERKELRRRHHIWLAKLWISWATAPSVNPQRWCRDMLKTFRMMREEGITLHDLDLSRNNLLRQSAQL